MHVAVGRLQMTLRWMPQTEMLKTRTNAITPEITRLHEREQRLRDVDTDRTRWQLRTWRQPW